MSERVVVVGSRDFPDEEMVAEHVTNLPPDTVVISGGASGVDTWAEQAAEFAGLETDIYPADWEAHGKRAGYVRNRTMVEEADRIVAFWDGESRGTRHSIKLAMESGKPLDIYVRREASDGTGGEW